MIKDSFWPFQICEIIARQIWQHLLYKKACTAFFRDKESVIHWKQTSTFMTKNVPNIINTVKTVDILTNMSQSFHVLNLKSSDSCPTFVWSSWFTYPKSLGKSFIRPVTVLRKVLSRRTPSPWFQSQSLLMGTKGYHQGARCCSSLCLPSGCYGKA